ncbi:hepatic triacylglycerol lipase isoform X3 [Ochotona princeps]|uniref:hepatic triacylglycerol lipase isoform X3 n=1 Tax=Ochotona princeps TaxID=9978 RepID=UPI002714D0DF|nr:hepatic triacylglycerol lipase isoform X3 [Ochotona princeps]
MGIVPWVPIFLVICVLIQSSALGQSPGQEPFGRKARVTGMKKTLQETKTKFLLFKDKANQGCQIQLHRPDTLQECGFNTSLPLVMIIHGWSVDGKLESWVWQLAAALKSELAQPVNVGLANWISLAHSHYATAVRNARLVGQEVAALLQWLEESALFSRSNVHLIGYSLGAHVSGFAGSYIGGKHKIGRITALSQTIKCAHERSVHLFIDSLLHPDMQSTAFQCSSMDSFSQGMCLSCTKGRCNTLGYHIRQEHHSKGKRLFLVTQAQSPFRVYHYQFKIQFINQIEKPVEPTFTMSLLGTKEEKQKIPITLGEGITTNKTYSFLITLDLDIGELTLIKFKWENSAVWANVWNTVQTIIPWGTKPRYSGLILKTIRVKAGESQQRMTFCSENMEDLQLHPTQEKNFVRCEVNLKTAKS